MSRYFTLIIIAVCFCGNTQIFAQKIDDDIIKIKNGPTIYGGLDSIRRDTVFFRVNGKIPVSYPVSQIEEFRKDSKYNYSNAKKDNLEKSPRPSNKIIARPDTTSLYISFSTGISFFRAISPKISLGYRLHQLFIPIASVDYTVYKEANGRFTGLSGGFTGSFASRVRRPYYTFEMGYGINQTPQSAWNYGEIISKTGGLKMDFGLGIINPIIDGNNLVSIGLNYGTQDATYVYTSDIWNWQNSRMEKLVINEKIRYNRLYLTLGIIF